MTDGSAIYYDFYGDIYLQDDITKDAWTLHDKFMKEISRIPRSDTHAGAIASSNPSSSKKSNGTSKQSAATVKSASASSSGAASSNKSGSGGGSITTKTERRKSVPSEESEKLVQAPAPAPTTSKNTSKPPPLKERYLWLLALLKEHHIVDEATGKIGVQTCWLFNKAVDPIHYPTYPTVCFSL